MTFLVIQIKSKMKSQELQSIINAHVCENCKKYIYIFQCIKNENKSEKRKADSLKATKKYQTKKAKIYKAAHLKSVKKNQAKNSETFKISNLESVKKYQKKIKTKFPPEPLSSLLQHKIASNFCKDTSPQAFEESGCAVCGKLTLLTELQKLSELDLNLDVLTQQNITQIERKASDDDFEDINGPIFEKDLDNICNSCYKSISKGKIPLLALANGKWIGKVPEELQNLSYAEQLLVARVRHNRCIVRVSSGMQKMKANAISFANPTPKIYNILPPPLEEMDNILAFIYTGPCKPTKSDFERIPLLVRHKKVAAALEWLKLNHQDYFDLQISYKNLKEYPEDMPPVVIDYKESIFNKDPESTAVNDMEDETGNEDGPCPFIVHGLTGEEYSTKGLKALKAIALKHLTDNKKIAAVRHHKNPETIYNNPQLFPQMMPWLFPYGLGGIGNKLQKSHISDIAHKRHLLMYYDKRFQLDPHFPLIAFNHEQIKESTTAGYLLAEKPKFDQISKRLMEVKSKEGQYVGFSGVHDYIYRPSIFENKTLYEWIQMATRIKATKFEDYSNIDSKDELDLINKSFKSDEVKISNYQKYKATVEEENEEEDELNIYTDDEFIEESFLNEKKEIKTEVQPSNLHLFLKEHPLYKTHKAKFDDKRKNIVPNFVGGSLPRCDREYYCATMLTLFKPWRSGKDLKNIDYSWDETFNLYEFTDQQKQYIKNFNVRYECNDARDDYSAQLKKGNSEGGLFPQWMNFDIINSLDEDDHLEGADFGDHEPDDGDDYGVNKYTTLGRLGKLRQQELEETRID